MNNQIELMFALLHQPVTFSSMLGAALTIVGLGVIYIIALALILLLVVGNRRT